MKFLHSQWCFFKAYSKIHSEINAQKRAKGITKPKINVLKKLA